MVIKFQGTNGHIKHTYRSFGCSVVITMCVVSCISSIALDWHSRVGSLSPGPLGEGLQGYVL